MNTNVGGGLASGMEKLANAYITKQRRQGLASGLEQINNGDYNGGVNTIAQYDPEMAYSIGQAQQNRQDALDKAQADRDFQREMMAQQFQNSRDMENLRNSNAYALADYKNNLSLKNQADALDKRNASIQAELDAGNITPQQAAMLKLGTDAKAMGIGDGGKETQAEKEQAKRDIQRQDFENSKPAVINAMQRGYAAAQSGWGLGGIGGTSFNPASWFGGKSNQNRADIQSSNTQMNSILRKQLASTGLTGSELNSAVEANAYRYTIDPTDNEETIKRKMQNFAVDVLGEDPSVLQQQNYKSKYGLE